MAIVILACGEAGVEYRTLDWLGDNYAFGNNGTAWTRNRHNRYAVSGSEWSPIVGFQTKQGYTRLLLRIASGKDGRRKFCLHRLVCEAFWGPPPFPGAKALHKNDLKWDNSAANLYWGTDKQNHQDRVKNGHSNISECHPRALFTNLQVREIRGLHATGCFAVKQLAKAYKKPAYCISMMVRGANWKHLPQTGEIPAEQCKTRPTQEDVA